VYCAQPGARAEVLLTPGVFLRVGKNSAIKMLDNRLVSMRLEVLSGTVIIESDDPQISIKRSPIALIYKEYVIRLVKHGLVEISSHPAQMKVYKGETVVDINNTGTANGHAIAREGRVLSFSPALLTEKFNDKVGDDLYLWARDRSQSLSAANMSSASSLRSNGMGMHRAMGVGMARVLETGAAPGISTRISACTHSYLLEEYPGIHGDTGSTVRKQFQATTRPPHTGMAAVFAARVRLGGLSPELPIAPQLRRLRSPAFGA
jgi:hypothetical protein